jgi:hypothetical protein
MTSRAGLSAAEVRHFREQGFVVPEHRIAPAEVAAMKSGVERIIDASPGLTNKPITTAHLAAVHGNDALMAHCLRPDILDMIEAIDGPDLILWTTSVFHKPAVSGVETPWHQDGEYWPMRPMAGTSAWIALTASHRENGCLRVVPCSHLTAREHEKSRPARGHFGRTLPPNSIPETETADIELEPGQMLLFHPMLVHGARANESAQARTGFVIRYMPSTSWFDHDGGESDSGRPPYADRALFLVRGVNRCDRNDLQRNHPS